jgi:hypothetical protein
MEETCPLCKELVTKGDFFIKRADDLRYTGYDGPSVHLACALKEIGYELKSDS